ncbi:MAG TPA: bifunctional nuclease domain-containing protein [Candidatus Binataceae bacterium]|nr:bifunctional nuclease domain-containing protein [Candidatus Binataceae bacterium]
MQAFAARHLCLLTLAATLAACACGQHAPAAGTSSSPRSGDAVRVTVATVGFDEAAQAHFVLLVDPGDRRELPILIGNVEAQSIVLSLRGVKPARPLTDNLLGTVISQTGNRIDRVEISNLRGEIYYAKIFMDDGKYTIDSRPSDAIALAMDSGAPIYVAAPLFVNAPHANLVEREPAQSGPRVATALGITVQDLTPALAAAFDLPLGGGVLVADTTPAAAHAGVARGDIVTQVDSRAITQASDFSAGIDAVKSTAPVAITFDRAGTQRTIMIAR